MFFGQDTKAVPCATLMKFVIRAEVTFQVTLRGVNNITIVQRIPRGTEYKNAFTKYKDLLLYIYN